MKMFGIVALTMLTTSPALARDLIPSECRPLREMVAELGKRKQTPFLRGAVEDGKDRFIMFRNSDTGEWTVVVIRMEGRESYACLEYTGTELKVLSPTITDF